jgi:hypothetical protein
LNPHLFGLAPGAGVRLVGSQLVHQLVTFFDHLVEAAWVLQPALNISECEIYHDFCISALHENAGVSQVCFSSSSGCFVSLEPGRLCRHPYIRTPLVSFYRSAQLGFLISVGAAT